MLCAVLIFATAVAATDTGVAQQPALWIRGSQTRGLAFAPSDIGSAVRQIVGGNNISHSSSEIFMAETGFVSPPSLFGKPLLLRSARSCRSPSMTQTIQRNDDNRIVDFFKRSLIALERTLVTITSGSELAEAQVIMEENRLFGSRRLHKLREHVQDRLGLNSKREMLTASMDDFYSAGPFSFSSRDSDPGHSIALRRQHAKPPTKPLKHTVETARLDDCYSPWGDLSTYAELSGGYNEGAGDDLPILNRIRPTKGTDQRYSEGALHRKFADTAFKEEESVL